MGKIIRLTEADLTRLVRRVIKEQSSQIKSVDNVKTAPKQSTGQLIKSVDNVKTTTPKQSVGTISSVMTKSDPKEWFSNFPCLKNISADRRKMVGGKIYNKVDDGKTYVLLPETGTYQENGFGRAREVALNDYVGKIQGGGLYYCHKEFTSKGLGLVLSK
jgi:hypothetical protein